MRTRTEYALPWVGVFELHIQYKVQPTEKENTRTYLHSKTGMLINTFSPVGTIRSST